LQQQNILEEFFAMSELSIVKIEQSFLRAGSETLDPSRRADVPRIKDLLAAPDAVRGLAYNGKAAEVVALVTALPRGAQSAILAAPDAVRALANNGQAAAVVALVKALPPGARTAILAAPDAVWGLAWNGQAAEVVALVKALPHDAQATILAAPDAVLGLAHKGQAAEVANIKAGWNRTAAKRPSHVPSKGSKLAL
jgi:hypothetical protein